MLWRRPRRQNCRRGRQLEGEIRGDVGNGRILVKVLTVLLLTVEPGRAISCGQVDSALAHCLEFLTGGPGPSPVCCDGVMNLKAMTPTIGDRRAACECMKEAAGHYASLKSDKASQLPQACGVQIGVPITKDVDCST
ncbi:non-specific lipid-transfer protein A-like [Pistacia vera]|uniref:non-specific lipid-transfer protein A-like n=1 Tax=Pistacia vera TaxID=55513 RepID=UPI00126318DC|nr:non-specific lipid-transfer protein A-like [Pistacia vera]